MLLVNEACKIKITKKNSPEKTDIFEQRDTVRFQGLLPWTSLISW